MSTAPASSPSPDPGLIFDAINGYQRSAALKAAIELDLFTVISNGNRTATEIAANIGAMERGVRILCDYLVIMNFLAKSNGQYSLTPNSAVFLDRNSPAFFGSTVRFMLDPHMMAAFNDLAQTVRSGLGNEGTVSPENPIWVQFAENMAPMVAPAAAYIAEVTAPDKPARALDIAAGHGLFGIEIARRNPEATVTAVDWPAVLEVARRNAQRFGVADRHSTIPGDAFEVNFGGPYDLVLATNFFHHFDQPTCERLMKKILAALTPGGKCITLEFAPNPDRVSPPVTASFSMMMLGTTAAGDAYTFAEYEAMFRNAGFASSEIRPLPAGPQSLIISKKS